MISTLLSRVVILVAGTLYPAYRSYKAVRTKDVKEYVKWMMYWIVFGLFCTGEALADIFIAFWFPFYYEIKIIFVIWLLSPWTRGASILYRKWIHPMLMKHEGEIDNFLEQAKNESYRQVVTLGSRGLACARDIVATAALRGAQIGQVQLADLHRSYSTGDISVASKTESRKLTVMTAQKQSFIEEEEEEEIRTWTGTYDEKGQIVEYPVLVPEETIQKFGNEEVVVVEDPGHHSQSRSGSGVRRRNSRSRSRTSGVSDPSAEFNSNTLPRRSVRNKRAGSDN